MEMKKVLDQLISDNKKEIDRLIDRRNEDLGNSINYVENELQIEHLKGVIEGLEEALNQL